MKILELIIDVVTKADSAIQQLDSLEKRFDRSTDRAIDLSVKLDRLGESSITLGKKLAKPSAIAAGLFYGAKKFGDSLVSGASELEESMNAINVVFEEGALKIEGFGQTAATEVGLSQKAFNKLSTQTGSLLSDVGLPLDKVADKTIMLTKRAADMASVFDTDVNDAMSAINQAIRGETEAIRRYAGDVTDATLETFLLSEGINKTVRELTQQEKRLYRVNLIMKQTQKTHNDFLNTNKSLANQQRINGALAENNGDAFGKRLLPVYKSFQRVLGKVILWFSQLSDSTKDSIVQVGLLATAVAGLIAILSPLAFAFGGIVSLAAGLFRLVGAIKLIGAATKAGGMIKLLRFFRKAPKLVGTIRKLSGGIKILSGVFAALFSPVGLIVGALISLGLVANDVWVFFQGGESVIGAMIDWMNKLGVIETAAGWFDRFKTAGGDALNSVGQYFADNFPKSTEAVKVLASNFTYLVDRSIVAGVALIDHALSNAGQRFLGLKSIVGNVIDAIKKLWGEMVNFISESPLFKMIDAISEKLGGVIGSGVDRAKEIGGKIKTNLTSGLDNLVAGTVNLVGAPVAQLAGATNSNVSFGDVTIQVPPGTTPQQAQSLWNEFTELSKQQSVNSIHATGGSAQN